MEQKEINIRGFDKRLNLSYLDVVMHRTSGSTYVKTRSPILRKPFF